MPLWNISMKMRKGIAGGISSFREGNNIKANVVEQINDSPLSFYAGFEVNYNDKNICFIEVSKDLFTAAVQELLTELQFIEK